jgi:hypothetical protein
MTATETLTSLLASFFAEPSADGLAVLADFYEGEGRQEEAVWLRALNVEQVGGYVRPARSMESYAVKFWLAKVGSGTLGEYRKEETAWKWLARFVEDRLTDRCPSTANDLKGCPICQGRAWLLKGQLEKYRCPSCQGTGEDGIDWTDRFPPVPCDTCDGRGWLADG